MRTNGELPRLVVCHVGVASLLWRDGIGGVCTVGGLGAPLSGRTGFILMRRLRDYSAAQMGLECDGGPFV